MATSAVNSKLTLVRTRVVGLRGLTVVIVWCVCSWLTNTRLWLLSLLLLAIASVRARAVHRCRLRIVGNLSVTNQDIRHTHVKALSIVYKH